MFRYLFLLLLLSLLLSPAVFFGCNSQTGIVKETWPEKAGPKVVTSFAPITCIVSNVLGDRGTIRGVMSSQGPHDFSPVAKDADSIIGADIFFINGLELDNGAAKKMKAGSRNDKLKIIDLGSKLDERKLLEGECHHDHKNGEPHDHEHPIDAHIWLGPDVMIDVVKSICKELQELDPEEAKDYDLRTKEYINKLEKLLSDGQEALKNKSNRRIITLHESMNYFARAFKVEVAGSIQAAPGQEPTRKQLEQVVKACLEKNVSVLAVEPQYQSSNAIQAIQRELKAKGLSEITVITLDPMETHDKQIPDKDFYEKTMRANIEALAKALK